MSYWPSVKAKRVLGALLQSDGQWLGKAGLIVDSNDLAGPTILSPLMTTKKLARHSLRALPRKRGCALRTCKLPLR